MELSHPHDAISSLLGAPVVAADGRRRGRVRDVVAEQDGDGAWTVVAVRVARWRGPRRHVEELPWAQLAALRDDGTLVTRT
jgi:sporulation protein YlmC with PRC-barrel domain